MKSLTTKKHDEYDLVLAKRNQAITTSLQVADVFKKKHKNVIQSIENIGCPSDFSRLNFQLSSYVNTQGKKQPMYVMTRDGFTLLAMGFTGKKAVEFKIKYIAAFNKMEKIIQQRSNAEWLVQRKAGKLVRRDLTDAIQLFVDYATEQGSKNADHYYANISKMTNKALFLVGNASPQPFRDMLAGMEHSCLAVAEGYCRAALLDGMNQSLPYKDIYQLAKQQVEVFAGTARGQRLLN